MDLFEHIQGCLDEAPDGQWLDIREVIDEHSVNEANYICKRDGKLRVLLITAEYNRIDNVKKPKYFDGDSDWYKLWIEWEVPMPEEWWIWGDEFITHEEILPVHQVYTKLVNHLTNDGVIVFNSKGEVI